MLVVEVSQIPPEGLNVNSALKAGELHVEGEDSFTLQGGSLKAFLEKGDHESVHVRGRLEARLELQCGRCLDPFPFAVDQELDLFYLPHEAEQEDEEEDEVELSDRDMVVAYYQGNRLDLGEMVREQLFLSAPMKRLCREECTGLCPSCGANRNVSPCGCKPTEDQDARFAPLKDLFAKGSS